MCRNYAMKNRRKEDAKKKKTVSKKFEMGIEEKK
jgi:hypothetical protein